MQKYLFTSSNNYLHLLFFSTDITMLIAARHNSGLGPKTTRLIAARSEATSICNDTFTPLTCLPSGKKTVFVFGHIKECNLCKIYLRLVHVLSSTANLRNCIICSKLKPKTGKNTNAWHKSHISSVQQYWVIRWNICIYHIVWPRGLLKNQNLLCIPYYWVHGSHVITG